MTIANMSRWDQIWWQLKHHLCASCLKCLARAILKKIHVAQSTWFDGVEMDEL